MTGVIRTHTLDRRKLEFSRPMIRTHSLDRRKVEFSGLFTMAGWLRHRDSCNEIGALLPIAPCGRSSL